MKRIDRTDLNSKWRRKGATLSDKTAQKEFGLTRDQIVQGIRAGMLHYQEASMHGNGSDNSNSQNRPESTEVLEPGSRKRYSKSEPL